MAKKIRLQPNATMMIQTPPSHAIVTGPQMRCAIRVCPKLRMRLKPNRATASEIAPDWPAPSAQSRMSQSEIATMAAPRKIRKMVTGGSESWKEACGQAVSGLISGK